MKSNKINCKNIGYFASLLVALTTSSLSEASTYEGKIKQIVFGVGQSPVRVSIIVELPHASSCVPTYYAYENADAGIAKLWTAAALTAYAAQKTVTIGGTGVCDIYGLEGMHTLVVQ